MTRSKMLGILFLLGSVNTFGQSDTATNNEMRDQILQYKKIYQCADSLNKLNQAGSLDTSIFKLTDSLDNTHPLGYYQKAAELMKDYKLNEAAFLFYLGSLRYRYYNSVNPDYQASGDGALSGSLQYVLGEPINMYLKTNPDNFLSILRKSVDWYLKHDYKFYSRNKDQRKYAEQSKGVNEIISDLEANKGKYKTDWNEEQSKFRNQIDSMLNEIDQQKKSKDIKKGN